MTLVIMEARLRDFCWYCGIHTQDEDDDRGDFRTRDHVVPRSRGGRGSNNIVTACRACNKRKKNHTLEYFRLRHGGGLFWGELFHPKTVPGTDLRPGSSKPFKRWRAMQGTVGKDDWMEGAKSARHLRSCLRDLEEKQRAEAEQVDRRGWRVRVKKLPRFVGFGVRWEDRNRRKVAIYVPFHIVVVGFQ